MLNDFNYTTFWNVNIFFLFLCPLVLAIKSRTLVPRHSQIYATSPRRNGKDWSAKSVGGAYRGNFRRRGGSTLWGTPLNKKINVSEEDFNRQVWLATAPELRGRWTTRHHSRRWPPLYQDDAFEGLFSCDVCGSCWDSWTKSTTKQFYWLIERAIRLNRAQVEMHGTGATRKAMGASGTFLPPLTLQCPPG